MEHPKQARAEPPALGELGGRLRCLDERETLERIDGSRTVRVRRQKLRLESSTAPLALRRLSPLDRPARARVLLVHGLGQNRRTWRQRERSFEAALADGGYEVFNLELRGHGNSRHYGSRPAAGVEQYVEDLGALLPQLGGSCFAIGHSLGAGVLLRATLAGLSFAGIIHYAGVYTFAQNNRFLLAAAALTHGARHLLPRELGVSLAPAGRVIAMRPALSDWVNRRVPISGWARRSIESPLLAARVRNGFDRVGLGVWMDMAAWARSGGLDPEGQLSLDTTPLLVLSGADDRLASVEDARACFSASGSPDKRLHVFDEATHGYAPGHIDIILGHRAPAVVWPVVLEWLERRTTHAD